ncbi:hypothetical protein WMC59_05260 [Staphylococcus delphini]|uniref:hypothetical protein n=1 Tax=Staphylococcus delphini TaxID=53344 RepID=UPI00374FC1A0
MKGVFKVETIDKVFIIITLFIAALGLSLILILKLIFSGNQIDELNGMWQGEGKDDTIIRMIINDGEVSTTLYFDVGKHEEKAKLKMINKQLMYVKGNSYKPVKVVDNEMIIIENVSFYKARSSDYFERKR